MIARNIMTRDVVTVDSTATVREAAQILTRQQLSGAPVVDERGRIVGIVSEADVIAHPAGRVADVMSKNILTVAEETPLEEIAALMMTRKIKRLPVLRGDKLVGIVSRADIVATVALGKHMAMYTPIYDL